MIDPLVLKAKAGKLSSGELESVLSELSEILRKTRIDPSFAYPRASKIDRLRVQLTDHDLASASRELHGKPTHRVGSASVQSSAASRESDAKPRRDPFLLLEIVGEAGGKELAKSVEPFLDWPDDPMVAMLALEILTTYWGLSDQYRDTIIKLMKGVKWDVENDVREVAITAAGEALRQQRDRELLQHLIDIARDENESSSIRGQAIASLGRAEGMSWQDLPNPADAILPTGELARLVLDRARAMTGEPDRN